MSANAVDVADLAERLARLEGARSSGGLPPSPPLPDAGSFSGRLMAAQDLKRLERIKAERDAEAAAEAKAIAAAAEAEIERERDERINRPRRRQARADALVLEQRLRRLDAERDLLRHELRGLEQEATA